MVQDKIGDILLEDANGVSFINEYSFKDEDVTLGGNADSINTIIMLKELFRFAPDNVVVKRVIGGERAIIDLTESQRNIVYCTFASSRLISGYYALRSFSYTPKPGYVTSYPFKMTLFFIGTDYFYKQVIKNFTGVIDNAFGI